MADKNWNTSYNSKDNSQLRKLQLVELNILKNFIDVCDKNNLRYFLIGGTMLGAVRHHGFIPWDDDMDIGMPRLDYERFLQVAPTALPKGLSLKNYKTDEKYNRYFSRVVDDNVLITNDSNTKTLVENAWVDIFPFDGMPSNKVLRTLHFWSLTVTRFFYHASCFEELVNLNRPGRPKYLQIIIYFLSFTHFGSNLDTKKVGKRIEKKLLKYGYDDSDYVINMFGAYMSKEIVSKRILGDFKRYQFENELVWGPEHYDEYLRQFYGDYLVPPKDADKDKHNIKEIKYKEE